MSKIQFASSSITVYGSSAAGAFVLGYAGKYPEEIDNIILQAPVWEYNWFEEAETQGELQEEMLFVKRAFKHIYRMKFDNLVVQLQKFADIHIENYGKKIKQPILLFHDKQDSVVPFSHTTRAMKILTTNILLENNSYGNSPNLDELKTLLPTIKKFILQI